MGICRRSAGTVPWLWRNTLLLNHYWIASNLEVQVFYWRLLFNTINPGKLDISCWRNDITASHNQYITFEGAQFTIFRPQLKVNLGKQLQIQISTNQQAKTMSTWPHVLLSCHQSGYNNDNKHTHYTFLKKQTTMVNEHIKRHMEFVQQSQVIRAMCKQYALDIE